MTFNKWNERKFLDLKLDCEVSICKGVDCLVMRPLLIVYYAVIKVAFLLSILNY